MTRKFTTAFAASILTFLVATAAVLAADAEPATPPHDGAMNDHHGMMMRQMSPDQLAQMTRMMENCNRMMEARPPASPNGPAPSTPHR